MVVESAGAEPGGGAADIGVVAPGGGEEDDLGAAVVEHGHDHGHIGQVGAAVVGGVGDEGVAGGHVGVAGDDRLHGHVH